MTLTRTDVVKAGTELLDAEGVEQLSMRRLAKHLGTGPATLYWHVRDKAELLLLILDETLGEVVVPAQGDWAERLRDALLASHKALLPRPALIEVLWEAGWVLGPETLRLADELVALIAESGLPDDEVGDTYISLITLLFGFVAAEGSTPGNPSYTELRTRAHFTEDDEPVDVAAAYPNLLRYGPDATVEALDCRFRYALDRFIVGIEARVQETRSSGAGAQAVSSNSPDPAPPR